MHTFSQAVTLLATMLTCGVVIAADAFKHMNNNGGLTLENGQAFRKEILSQGNSKDPMQQYIDWRGQEPTVEALLERRGLTDPSID